jgi:hypothetical protein
MTIEISQKFLNVLIEEYADCYQCPFDGYPDFKASDCVNCPYIQKHINKED